MKKQLLLFLILPFLPASIFAQISIGDTNYDALSDAIAASVDGDIIEIAGAIELPGQVGLGHTDGATRTIKGTTADAKISLATGTRFILEGAGGVTTFEDITIVGADTPHDDWGAMFAMFNGSKLIFKNDTIRNAKTSQHAGAIRATAGSTVEAFGTVFRDNEASVNGGVIFLEGANSQLTLEDCLFLNNKAGVGSNDAKGGAIFVNFGGGNKGLNAKNCAFIGNSSSNHGGVFGSESIPMTFVNCTFSANTVNNNGGVIWLFNSSAEFTTTLINSTFYGNNAGDNGGAIFMNHTTSHVDLQNTVVTGSTGNGSAIACAQADATIEAKHSFFAALPEGLTESETSGNNIHTGDLFLADIDLESGVLWHEITSGASLLAILGDPALLASSSSTDQRGVERDMEAEYISAGSFQFEGEIIVEEVPSYVTIGDIEYPTLVEAIGAAVSGNVIKISGPAILTEQVGLAHASGLISFKGTVPGASIKLADGARFILEAAGETIFEDLTIIGADQVHEDWGAMMTLFNGPTLTLKNDTLRGAKSSAHAGAIRITSGATVEAYNSVFMDNECASNGGVSFIEAGNTQTHYENCVFINNKAGVGTTDAKGGALFYAHGADMKDHEIINCAFINNSSSNHGGALGAESVPLEIVNTTFSGNAAFDNGGAIWMWNSTGEDFTTTLVNCTMYGNTASNGGAFFMNQVNTLYEILNTVITENTSAAEIAAAALPATISARNSYFPALMEGLTESNGATSNLNEGELFLADIDLSEGVVWHDITSKESVLVKLGNPGLLSPYSNKDQRGTARNLNGTFITAGSIQYIDLNPLAVEEDEMKNKLHVYPNPTTGYMVMNLPSASHIAIYDAKGGLMENQYLPAGENRIDTSHLLKNVYILKSTSAHGVDYVKFIKN